MLKFQQWLAESPVIEGDYSLEHKFDTYNRLLFDGRIPRCPITWGELKSAGGTTYYSTNGRTILPGSLRIVMNTKFKRTEQGLDALVIHELVHAFLAVTTGDGDGRHGWRFQSQAHRCSSIVGFQIPLGDTINDLELTNDEKKMTTVVMYNHKGQSGFTGRDGWYANYYSGTAFDTPKKMDELVAFWGSEDRLKPGQEMLVIKIETNLAIKYGLSKTVRQVTWHPLSPSEEEDIMRRGQVIRKILPNSVSDEEAMNKLPTKQALVVLQTNLQRNTIYAVFLVPTIARDMTKMVKLRDKWRPYYEPGVRNIEIFLSTSTLFSRGYKMKKDETSGSTYILKPDQIAELRRNAIYIERWV
jgi:hypothetical protein